MSSETYAVMYGDCVLGREMSLADAYLFLKALMERDYNERELTLSIRRENNDVEDNDVETYRR